jgi:glycosyltransferase involved in cell wall biosynthesis
VKVLLIGSYPPPLGGVGVFVKRYRHELEGAGHAVDVIDPARFAKRELYLELYRATGRRYDLISLNFPSFHMMMLLLARGRAGRTEVWDHNWRVLEEWNPLRRGLYELFLRRCRELVLVAPHIKDYYLAHGVELPAHTRVRHAFLPPPPEEEESIIATYPADVLGFVRDSRPLVVANAFRVVLRDGVDLYGLDMCVRLVAGLKETYPNVGLLFALADVGEPSYFERIGGEVSARGLGRNVHFMTGQRELWPLFKRADLMVRPTLSDGYALSVAEALHFGCPVVASDAAERPPGATLFATRDGEDFLRKCRAVLAADDSAARPRGVE